MAETLGSLCDKLTIIKLKQWHTSKDNGDRLNSLSEQENQIQVEIDEFLSNAMLGNTSIDRLVFASNKVFKSEGNMVSDIQGTIGEIFSQLSEINCNLWHEQEKVYDFAAIPADQKDEVVKQLAVLNLNRNRCIDQIDQKFQSIVRNKLT